MPAKEWIEKYEAIKDSLMCETDLDSYFTQKKIGGKKVTSLHIGTVNLPTGTIFACDPLIELEYAHPYIQTVPAGTYPVKICVILSKDAENRYACVKTEISSEKPVRYELGMTGQENLEDELEEGDFFGFPVDAGMACIADISAQEAFRKYWAHRLEEDEDIDPYNDLFCDLLEENFREAPRYQREEGSWINWTVPESDCNIAAFDSGWGDGVYPCYFGYDADGRVCGIYILFIDIEKDL